MTQVKLLKITEVQERVNLTRSHIYRLMATGDFPQPLKFGRASRWRSDELDTWVTADHPRRTHAPKAAVYSVP